MTLSEKSQIVKKLALDEGFDLCGITKAQELSDDAVRLQAWLAARYNADMQWMENNFEKRTNPALLVEGAKSVIIVLVNYYPSEYPFENKHMKISRYALGVDYHFVVKEKLHRLFEAIKSNLGELKGRVFVDSAPVMERALARQAGLGWIGKNSLLLNKKLGSYFFIGELIVDMELEYDTPVSDHCGNCRKCIEACPTRAIVADKVIDSNKCISYHTIENKGDIPQDIAENMKGRIFGCDICQEVCPWNVMLKPTSIRDLDITYAIKNLTDSEIESLSEGRFENVFLKSPVMRTKYSGFVRNIKYNSAI